MNVRRNRMDEATRQLYADIGQDPHKPHTGSQQKEKVNPPACCFCRKQRNFSLGLGGAELRNLLNNHIPLEMVDPHSYGAVMRSLFLDTPANWIFPGLQSRSSTG